jgi:hypothetical protein
MTKFADQLLADLMREHGSTLAHTMPPAAPRRHLPAGRKLLATGAGGVAVAATVGALVAGGGTPAYAVTTHPDGTVTLAIYRASGIAGANARLRQLGDRVVVVPVRPGCPDTASLPAPAVTAHGKLLTGQAQQSDGSLTVNAEGIPARDIMVVVAQTTAQGRTLTATLTSPPPPSCVSPSSLPPGNGGP